MALNHHQNQDDGSFTVNGVSFQPPSVPVLLQILSGTKNASDLLPSGSIYGLNANKSVELTIPALALAGPVSRSILAASSIVLTPISILASYTSTRCKQLYV
jgi:hypothetical protein